MKIRQASMILRKSDVVRNGHLGLLEIRGKKDQNMDPAKMCEVDFFEKSDFSIILNDENIKERVEKTRSLFQNIGVNHQDNKGRNVLDKNNLPFDQNLSIFVDEYDPSHRKFTNGLV